MGPFSFWKKPTPDQIRERVFDAAQAGDGAAFARLCDEHEATILASWKTWSVVPVELRKDPAAIQRFGSSLLAIAQHFAARGRPELMGALMGGRADGSDPVRAWNRAYNDASRLQQAGRYNESEAAFLALMTELERAGGDYVDELRSKIFGALGVNRFRQGDLEAARRFTRQALDACVARGDGEGIAIYTETLATLGADEEPDDDAPTPGTAPEAEVAFLERLLYAQRLSDLRDYDRSTLILQLARDKAPAALVQRYEAKINGLLGYNCYRRGDVSGAIRFTRQALECCERDGDQHGRNVYTANLEEMES